MRRILIAFCLFLTASGIQPAFSSEIGIKPVQEAESIEEQRLADSVALGFEAIYQFRFAEANVIAKELQNKHPEHPWTRILTVNYYWWQIITGDDSEALRKEYLVQINNAIEIYDDTQDFSHLDRYTLITLYGFKARIEILNKHYFSVVSLLNNYISNLKITFGQEDSFEWYNLSSGIYNYYIERSKNTHPILKPYLSLYPKGDSDKGIEQLKLASQSSNIVLSSEAEYFLMKIKWEEEEDLIGAASHAKTMVDRFPGNTFYRYLYYSILLNQDKLDEALVQYGQLSLKSSQNSQLSPTQKEYFTDLAKKDLTQYHLKKAKSSK